VKNIFACLFLCGTIASLKGAIVFYDSFDYGPAGTPLSVAGSSFWSLRNTGAPIDPTIAEGSVSYPGLQTVGTDNSIAFNGTGASGIASRVLGDVYNLANGPTLYYSLTFRVTSITGADWGGQSNWPTGAFMMGFSQDTGIPLNNPNVAAPLLIRTGDPANVTGNADGFPGFQLGTGVTSAQNTTSRVFDTTHVYSADTTLFLVFAYTFGPNASDDVARLWVNPVPGSAESANTPVVTTTGTPDVVNGQIQGFFLRNNPVQPTSTVIDNLRVGTAWEDVTPVPEPGVCSLLTFGVGSLGGCRLRRGR